MNLIEKEFGIIEKYGSYQNAKSAYLRKVNEGFSDDDFKSKLLEYRRQNEIYELGDLVVYEVGYKFVMEVGRDRKKGKLLVRRKKEGTNFALYCSPTAAIRHATDEEIEKGCRV